MFRSYFAVAWRNLARNRLFAGINIIGLAIGFAAAILIASYVHDELEYDHFIPDYPHVYRLSLVVRPPDAPAMRVDAINHEIGPWVRLQVPGITAIARLLPSGVALHHQDVEANESVYFADPSLFDVLQLKPLAGDLRSALDSPDSVVLTRAMARKYFGTDAPLGATLEVDRQHTLRVTAVLEDLPSTTHLNLTIL